MNAPLPPPQQAAEYIQQYWALRKPEVLDKQYSERNFFRGMAVVGACSTAFVLWLSTKGIHIDYLWGFIPKGITTDMRSNVGLGASLGSLLLMAVGVDGAGKARMGIQNLEDDRRSKKTAHYLLHPQPPIEAGMFNTLRLAWNTRKSGKNVTTALGNLARLDEMGRSVGARIPDGRDEYAGDNSRLVLAKVLHQRGCADMQTLVKSRTALANNLYFKDALDWYMDHTQARMSRRFGTTLQGWGEYLEPTCA